MPAVAEKKISKKEVAPPKAYSFQLVEVQANAKPVDKDTGEMVENPYPPYFIAPNSGVARDPKTGKQRMWRYVFGLNSIWVDEQSEPSKTQLSSGKNDLVFLKGYLTVQAGDTAKYDALTVQDGFEGNKNPLENTPKLFRLIDASKDRAELRNKADEAYEAEKVAREADIEEMLPVADIFDIDVEDGDEYRIRTEFILVAKTNPSAFLRQFVNPKNKIQYVVKKALEKNLIKVEGNQVIFVETQKALFDVKGDADLAEQVSTLVLQNHEGATKLHSQLQRLV